MLTHLRLQGFKSWKDTGDIALRPITGIFGANSSGKTSLIQALLLLKQTAESSDRNLTLHFGDRNTPTDLGDFGTIVHGPQTTGAIEISLGWQSGKSLTIRDTKQDDRVVAKSSDLEFRTRVEAVDGQNGIGVSASMMSYRVGDAEFGMRRESGTSSFQLFATDDSFGFVRALGRTSPLPRPIKCYGFPDEARARFQNAGFLADLAFALEERLRSVHYLGPLRAHPRREYSWLGEQPADVGPAGEQAVSAMLSSGKREGTFALGQGMSRTLEQHVAWWLKELGLIRDFHVARLTAGSPLYQVKVRKSAGAPETLITDVGFGVSQILPVLVLCFYAPRGSTIILEQPDLHLHQSAQAGLADVLIDAHKRRGVQIIVESHSEHLLTRLQRRIAEEQLANDDVALFFCEDRGSCSSITELQVDPYGNISNWPTDFFGDEFGEIAAMSLAGIERKLAAGE